MTVVNFNNISGINSITAQSTSLNFYDSAGNTLSIGASVTGNITGNVTGNVTGNLTGNVTGTVNSTGVITATSFSGNVTGNVNATGISTFSSTITTGNVGIQTNDITRSDLVGAGNSFVGLYIGDGFLAFSTSLNRPDGYYISTSINALNAGPVTLGSTMTLHGTWVIV